MTISVGARNLSGQNYDATKGLTYQRYMGGVTGAWQAQDISVAANRVALATMNHYGRFPQDVFVRLPFMVPYGTTPYGKIGGIVQEELVNVRRTVRLYHRPTGRFVGQYVSRHTGEYNFSYLTVGELYDAVALDDPAAPSYNDLIIGSLVPVTDGSVVEDPNYPPGGVP